MEPPPKRLSSWGQALRVQRIRHGLSCHQLASNLGLAGVDKNTVKDWERGDAFPSALPLKRVYDALPKMKYYNDLIPGPVMKLLVNRALSVGDEGRQLWVPPSPTPDELPAPADLSQLSFGIAFQVALIEEELEIDDITSLMGDGLDATQLVKWQTNEVVPSDSQYAVLLELLPQLGEAPGPGEVDSTAPPIQHSPVSSALTVPTPAPSPQIITKVVKVVTSSPRTKVDEAGIRHANALLALKHAEDHKANLEAELKELTEEIVELKKESKESEKELMAAVHATVQRMS